jgi:hypothetical protein
MYSEFSDERVASIFRVTELGSCERATCTLITILQEVLTQNKSV